MSELTDPELTENGDLLQSIPDSGWCSLVTDNTIQNNIISCKILLGTENLSILTHYFFVMSLRYLQL